MLISISLLLTIFLFRIVWLKKPLLSLIHGLLFLTALSLTFLSLAYWSFTQFADDIPLLKITCTGHVKQELVEWKNPTSSFQKKAVNAYEVTIESLNGGPIIKRFVYGDLVGIRAKVIRLKPWMNAIGLKNLYKIEGLYNGYTTVLKTNTSPLLAYELSSSSLFYERLWDKVFFQQIQSSFAKTATLESTYFPLVNPDGSPFIGTFYLTMTSGGLSGIRT